MASIDRASKRVSLALVSICFRDWCQEQVVRVTMSPEDYILYLQITRRFFGGVTPYEEFRHQMVVLLQNPEYAPLRVYWDVLNCWTNGEVQMANHPQFFYPIRLCLQLNLIPAFAFIFFGYPALWNHTPQLSQQQAAQMAAEEAAQETAQKAAQETAQKVAQETAQKVAQEVAQETAQEVAQEVPLRPLKRAHESDLEAS